MAELSEADLALIGDHLLEVHRKLSLSHAISLGGIVVKKVLGGDIDAWRANPKAHPSIRQLAKLVSADRPVRLSYSLLYRSLQACEINQRLKLRSIPGVTLGHALAVHPLPPKEQERWLRQVAPKNLSVRRLQAAIGLEQGKPNRDVRKSLAQLQKKTKQALAAADAAPGGEREELLGELEKLAKQTLDEIKTRRGGAPAATDARQAPSAEPAATEAPSAEPAAAEAPRPEPAATESPTAEPSTTESASAEPAATEAPSPEPTEAPSSEPTEAPSPEPTEAPSPEPAATGSPSAEPAATESPSPEPAATESAATEAPSPEPAATESPSAEPDAASRAAADSGATAPPPPIASSPPTPFVLTGSRATAQALRAAGATVGVCDFVLAGFYAARARNLLSFFHERWDYLPDDSPEQERTLEFPPPRLVQLLDAAERAGRLHLAFDANLGGTLDLCVAAELVALRPALANRATVDLGSDVPFPDAQPVLREIWDAFCAPTPTPWDKLRDRVPARFVPAFDAWLRELPAHGHGRGASQGALLEAARDQLSAGDALRRVALGSPLDPAALELLLLGLVQAGAIRGPTVPILNDQGMDEGEREEELAVPLALTPLGESLLAGADLLPHAVPRWWGGTKITPRSTWRVDPTTGRLPDE